MALIVLGVGFGAVGLTLLTDWRLLATRASQRTHQQAPSNYSRALSVAGNRWLHVPVRTLSLDRCCGGSARLKVMTTVFQSSRGPSRWSSVRLTVEIFETKPENRGHGFRPNDQHGTHSVPDRDCQVLAAGHADGDVGPRGRVRGTLMQKRSETDPN